MKLFWATRSKESIAERGKKIGDKRRGQKHTKEAKRKIGLGNRGKIRSIEVRARQSERAKIRFAKMGIVYDPQLLSRLRRSFEYRLWREAVFKRDNYTCIWCFERGGKLNADHIKPFAYFPELRFAIDNGRTLCVQCHKTTDTYAGRVHKLYG